MATIKLTAQEYPTWYEDINNFIKINNIQGDSPLIDESNVPLCVELNKTGDSWELSWINFMPRKESTGIKYSLIHQDRQILCNFIERFFTPLYRNAYDNIHRMSCDAVHRAVHWCYYMGWETT